MLLYDEALRIVLDCAEVKFQSIGKEIETVCLGESVGRITATPIYSPASFPPFDSSAMDGYALSSQDTVNATPENPIMFRVNGTISAGDASPKIAASEAEDEPFCIEIMTGAPFPQCVSEYRFDACIKIEDTINIQGGKDGFRYVIVKAPVKQHNNRRFAGCDIQKHDLLIPGRSTLRPQDVMVLASVGIYEIPVIRKIRVAVISTGAEVLSWGPATTGLQDGKIWDCNGPYIQAFLRDAGADVSCINLVGDCCHTFVQELRKLLANISYDFLVSSGGVSVGKFDIVRQSIEALGGKIDFHNVLLRPGKPVLFANIPDLWPSPRQNDTSFFAGKAQSLPCNIAYFGLPGNPIAAAATLRFFVMPYLQAILLGRLEKPVSVRMIGVHPSENSKVAEKTEPLIRNETKSDMFRHAVIAPGSFELEAYVLVDQSPGKTSPWLQANCWLRIPCKKLAVMPGDYLDAWPIDAGSMIHEPPIRSRDQR